jgi:hypothetical protein
MNRYYNNHEEELEKKREYRVVNKEIINERRREARAKKRNEKPKPDIIIPYYQAMLSDVSVDYLKNLTGYNVTVKILRTITQRYNVKLGKLNKKEDIINCLIQHDILSDVALCNEDAWETMKNYSSFGNSPINLTSSLYKFRPERKPRTI